MQVGCMGQEGVRVRGLKDPLGAHIQAHRGHHWEPGRGSMHHRGWAHCQWEQEPRREARRAADGTNLRGARGQRTLVKRDVSGKSQGETPTSGHGVLTPRRQINVTNMRMLVSSSSACGSYH
jgi:hypothetical protein